MDQLVREASLLWTPDLTVGDASMDARNREIFARLSDADAAIGASSAADLGAWLLQLVDLFETLLYLEEVELAAIGYPELDYHRQLHAQCRLRLDHARTMLHKAADGPDGVAAQLARQICNDLAVWLMRHLQDADKLFYPYVDNRFRQA